MEEIEYSLDNREEAKETEETQGGIPQHRIVAGLTAGGVKA